MLISGIQLQGQGLISHILPIDKTLQLFEVVWYMEDLESLGISNCMCTHLRDIDIR